MTEPSVVGFPNRTQRTSSLCLHSMSEQGPRPVKMHAMSLITVIRFVKTGALRYPLPKYVVLGLHLPLIAMTTLRTPVVTEKSSNRLTTAFFAHRSRSMKRVQRPPQLPLSCSPITQVGDLHQNLSQSHLSSTNLLYLPS